MLKSTYKEITAVKIGDIDLPLEIHFDWRMSVRVSLAKDKAILRVPMLTTPAIKEKHLRWAADWIQKKLGKNKDLIQRYIPKTYQQGDIYKVYDKEYILHIHESNTRKTATAKFESQNIYIEIPYTATDHQRAELIPELLSKIFSAKYLPAVKKRIQYWNELHFHQNIVKVSMRNNQSNWGSCSINKTISISSRLLLTPPYVLDYIIVHELCHLIHHDHSERYWSLVARVMPQYMDAEEWLKKHGESAQW